MACRVDALLARTGAGPTTLCSGPPARQIKFADYAQCGWAARKPDLHFRESRRFCFPGLRSQLGLHDLPKTEWSAVQQIYPPSYRGELTSNIRRLSWKRRAGHLHRHLNGSPFIGSERY